MFPYIIVWDLKIYMTSIGILVAFVTFLISSIYFCKKYKQNFWTLFQRVPILVGLMYLLSTYFNFVFNTGIFPKNYWEFLTWISPYGFPFHFIWLLLGAVISIGLFIKKIKRYENKKVRIDLLFFSITIAIIPLGFFLLLGDDFIGKSTESLLGVKALHPDSQLNKFNAVYPVGILLSILAIIATITMWIIKRVKKTYGLGMRWFILLIIGINIIFFIQQYPKYGIVSIGGLVLDIKHHISFLVIMYMLSIYYKRKRIS